MLLLTIIILGTLAVLLGRAMMGCWLNHLSLYSAGFGLSLSAYATDLIHYNPISAEAWIILIAGWLAVFFGSAAVLLCCGTRIRTSQVCTDTRLLRTAILFLSIAGFASVALQVKQTIHEFGGILQPLLSRATDIYALRMRGYLSGEPYLAFFGYAGCAVAGVYTALKGRLTFVGVAPLLVVTASVMLSMQRAGLVITGLIFVFAFVCTPRQGKFRMSAKVVWALGCVLSLVVVTFVLVAGRRGMYTAFQGQDPLLTQASKRWSDLPSHYMYLSAPGPALNQYLERPELSPKGLFASYSFQSGYRLVSKLGFATYVPYYPPFVHTPVETNQATYLAYLYSDFGAFGVVALPFLVAGMTTALALRINRRPTLACIMIYAHLLLIFAFAFSWYIVSATFFQASMILSAAIGAWADEVRPMDARQLGIPRRR